MAGQSSYKDKKGSNENAGENEMETRDVIPIWGISSNREQHSGFGAIVKNT